MRPSFTAVVPTLVTGLALSASVASVACAGAQAQPQTAGRESKDAGGSPATEVASARPPPPPSPASSESSELTGPSGPAVVSPGELAGRTLVAIRDAFNAHDADKVARQFADDCAVVSYLGGETHGRADLSAALQQTFGAFGDVKVALLRGWVKGSVAVSEVAWTGTMSGDFMGLKASGRPTGLYAVRVMHLTEDGLVKEMHEYGDAAGLVAQMRGKKGAPALPVLPANTLALHVAKGTPEEDQLGVWARGLDDAYAAGDAKSVVATMSDDADYWTNFGGPAVKGKRALEKSVGAWVKAFPDQKWDVIDAWGVDGFAIIEHTMSGTQKGAFADRPASKKPVAGWRRVDILQPAAEGTVLHGWGFANVMEVFQQTGAIKVPADLYSTNAAPAAARITRNRSAPPAPQKQ